MKASRIHLVLFYCGLRTGHFGQGAFVNSLLPYFETKPNISITLIKTDCDDILKVSVYAENGMNIIAIPRLPNMPMLTAENHPIQKAYAQHVIGIIYPYLKDKSNLLFWINSIDYLNVSYELKHVFATSRLMYVHHSFSWKYFINVSDDVFINEWKKGNIPFHAKAFEMTQYQQEIALIADLVVTVTNHARDFFINVLDVPAHKITSIYNGSLVPKSQEENKQGLRKKYGFTRNEKIILFSGRITNDKGFPDLLRAFKLFADKNKKAKLVVMGAGNIFDYASIVEPYWSKIIYTGKLGQQQVSEFYRLADIGVIPSLHEQCSFTAIEMRLHKLPMIVSSVDGLDELFTHEQDALKLTVHVNKKGEKMLDEKEFAGCIERMMTDKKLTNRLIKNSYKKGIQLFTAQVMWGRYEQVLTTIFD